MKYEDKVRLILPEREISTLCLPFGAYDREDIEESQRRRLLDPEEEVKEMKDSMIGRMRELTDGNIESADLFFLMSRCFLGKGSSPLRVIEFIRSIAREEAQDLENGTLPDSVKNLLLDEEIAEEVAALYWERRDHFSMETVTEDQELYDEHACETLFPYMASLMIALVVVSKRKASEENLQWRGYIKQAIRQWPEDVTRAICWSCTGTNVTSRRARRSSMKTALERFSSCFTTPETKTKRTADCNWSDVIKEDGDSQNISGMDDVQSVRVEKVETSLQTDQDLETWLEKSRMSQAMKAAIQMKVRKVPSGRHDIQLYRSWRVALEQEVQIVVPECGLGLVKRLNEKVREKRLERYEEFKQRHREFKCVDAMIAQKIKQACSDTSPAQKQLIQQIRQDEQRTDRMVSTAEVLWRLDEVFGYQQSYHNTKTLEEFNKHSESLKSIAQLGFFLQKFQQLEVELAGTSLARTPPETFYKLRAAVEKHQDAQVSAVLVRFQFIEDPGADEYEALFKCLHRLVELSPKIYDQGSGASEKVAAAREYEAKPDKGMMEVKKACHHCGREGHLKIGCWRHPAHSKFKEKWWDEDINKSLRVHREKMDRQRETAKRASSTRTPEKAAAVAESKEESCGVMRSFTWADYLDSDDEDEGQDNEAAVDSRLEAVVGVMLAESEESQERYHAIAWVDEMKDTSEVFALDSGASVHMVGSLDLAVQGSLQKVEAVEITLGNGGQVMVDKVVRVYHPSLGLELQHLYLPGCMALISALALVQTHNARTEIQKFGSVIVLEDGRKVPLHTRKRMLYLWESAETCTSMKEGTEVVAAAKVPWQDLDRDIEKDPETSAGDKHVNHLPTSLACRGCSREMDRLPRTARYKSAQGFQTPRRSKAFFQALQVDHAKASNISIDGYSQVLTVSDQGSGALFARLVAGEPMGESTMRQLRSIVLEANRVPESVRTDGGAPFRSTIFRRYLEESGILHLMGTPGSATSYSRHEIYHKYLHKAVRRILGHASLPVCFWSYAVLYYCWARFRYWICPGTGMTPYEFAYGRKYHGCEMFHFGVGCKARDYLAAKDKHAPNAFEGVVLGRCQGAYIVMDFPRFKAQQGKVRTIITSDVKIVVDYFPGRELQMDLRVAEYHLCFDDYSDKACVTCNLPQFSRWRVTCRGCLEGTRMDALTHRETRGCKLLVCGCENGYWREDSLDPGEADVDVSGIANEEAVTSEKLQEDTDLECNGNVAVGGEVNEEAASLENLQDDSAVEVTCNAEVGDEVNKEAAAYEDQRKKVGPAETKEVGSAEAEERQQEMTDSETLVVRRSGRIRTESKLASGDFIRTDAFRIGRSNFAAVMKAVPKKEALDSKQGRLSMKTEWANLKLHDALDMDNVLPVEEAKRRYPGARFIRSSFLFHIKHHELSEEEHTWKCRFVVLGNKVRNANGTLVDDWVGLYEKPVGLEACRIIMAFGMQRCDHVMLDADVNAAFLQTKYEGDEKIFIILDKVVQRENIVDLLGLSTDVMQMKDPCCSMLAVMYGTTVAPYEFGQLNRRVMLDEGFRELRDFEQNLWIKRIDNQLVAACTYVDDIKMAGETTRTEAAMKGVGKRMVLKESIQINGGRFLGMQAHELRTDAPTKRTLALEMGAYLDLIFEEYRKISGFVGPFKERHSPFLKIRKEHLTEYLLQPGVCKGKTHRIKGMLLWAVRTVRLDVKHTMGVIGSFGANNWSRYADQRLLYLVEFFFTTRDFGLHFDLDSRDQGNYSLECYVDSDHGGCLMTARSTTGYVTRLVGPNGTNCVFSVGARKQLTASGASAIAEMKAFNEALKVSFIPVGAIVDEILGRVNKVIYCDNKAVIQAIEKGYSAKLRYLSKTDKISIAELHDTMTALGYELQYIESGANLADHYTKDTEVKAFQLFQAAIGIRPLDRSRFLT